MKLKTKVKPNSNKIEHKIQRELKNKIENEMPARVWAALVDSPHLSSRHKKYLFYGHDSVK
jgi:hypothetical protein